jgi:membrane protein
MISAKAVVGRAGERAFRIALAGVKALGARQLGLWATSLAFTTLFSLIPVLAIIFTVLKVLGLHTELEPTLVAALEPLGPNAADIAGNIVRFVENVDVAVLGVFGVGFLLYALLLLLWRAESAFNHAWQTTGQRPFLKRTLMFVIVTLFGPALVFGVVTAIASLTTVSLLQDINTIEPVRIFIDFAAGAIPFVTMTVVFTIVNIVMPNAKVNLLSGLICGAVSSVLWQIVGWTFSSFIVESTNYAAVYASLATPMIFMVWIQVSWLIVLFGACVAYYHQHPEMLAARGRGAITPSSPLG